MGVSDTLNNDTIIARFLNFKDIHLAIHHIVPDLDVLVPHPQPGVEPPLDVAGVLLAVGRLVTVSQVRTISGSQLLGPERVTDRTNSYRCLENLKMF